MHEMRDALRLVEGAGAGYIGLGGGVEVEKILIGFLTMLQMTFFVLCFLFFFFSFFFYCYFLLFFFLLFCC